MGYHLFARQAHEMCGRASLMLRLKGYQAALKPGLTKMTGRAIGLPRLETFFIQRKVGSQTGSIFYDSQTYLHLKATCHSQTEFILGSTT